MGRKRFYFLLNVCTARKNFTDDGMRKYCIALKDDAIYALRKKNFDFDAWIKKINAALPKKISLADEPRLCEQPETLAQISETPKKLLKDLNAEELNPIRKLVEEFRAELENEPAEYKRAKIIFEVVSKLPNNSAAKSLSLPKKKPLTEFFPGVIFDKEIHDKYPRAHKLHLMILEEIFSVNIAEENFLSIMEKYFRIRLERNQSNHAREDFGEFKTAEDLRKFMSEAIDEIKKNLPAD